MDLSKALYPEDKHQEYLMALADGDDVLHYNNEQFIYQLNYEGGKFRLGNAPLPPTTKYTEAVPTNEQTVFETLDAFWNSFSTNPAWYTKYRPVKVERVMEKYIVTAHNELLAAGEMSYEAHQDLHRWMNRIFNTELPREVYWQFCANCRTQVSYHPRYPKYICTDCVSLVRDELGHPVNFGHTHQLKRSRDGAITLLKDTTQTVRLFIGQDEYRAGEARFGGVVYQKLE